MHEKVLEILIYLMNEFNQRQGALENISELSQGLLGHGYTENEINLAFSWFFEKLEDRMEDSEMIGTDSYSKDSVRILHEAERLVFLPDAYGYLLRLKALGLIDLFQMETIIERAMMTGNRDMSAEDIKAIVASVVFGGNLDWVPRV